MKTLKKNWWLVLVRGIILLVLGILIFGHPITALIGIAFYIGFSLLFTGIAQMIISISAKGELKNWGWGLTIGIIDILFAFLLLANPVVTAASLPFFVGFWIIISGIMTFINAFQYKKDSVPYWWLGLIGGLISVFIGYIISSNILVGTLTITIWMGIGFVVAGIISMNYAFRVKALKI